MPAEVAAAGAAVEAFPPSGEADEGADAAPLPPGSEPGADGDVESAPVVASAGLAADFDRLASRASFLAQPEPLNTMAGVDSARFIAPPHRSQVVGPGAEIACITSTTWPHDPQT